MSKTEVKPESIVLEHFTRPNPGIAVFIVGLMSHVDQNKRVTQYGDGNTVHFNIKPANTNPLFFHSFYFEHPLLQIDGTYLMGGVDQNMGTANINGQNHQLYRTYELFYHPSQGFRVMALQSAIPTYFEGKEAITLWQSKMSNKGVQRLSQKIRANT